MFRNNKQSWIPIFSCILLSAVLLLISLCLILSLIPIYINNRSVAKTSTLYSVYTVNNVIYTSSGNTNKQIRTIRDTLSSPVPSSNMISSTQTELNTLFSSIGASVVVSSATMSSANNLFLNLKIYFLNGKFASELGEIKLIKQILTKGQTITIYKEYYLDCLYDVVTVRTTSMILNNDINNNQISRSTGVSIASLVQQPDLCANSCTRVDASEVFTPSIVNIGMTFQYYCYYFVPSASATNINVQFTFASSSLSAGILIDDVTLNSTANLITNGGFETSDQGDGTPPSWTVSNCGGVTCLFGLVSVPHVHTGSKSFGAVGTDVALSQTIAINTVGRQFVYRLGFWLASHTFSSGEVPQYSFSGKLTTT